MDLPALIVQVEGRVVSSNLAIFREAASTFIANIKTDLQTDVDFANAEQTVKFCKEGEERLEVVKAQALSQTASIDELFRTVDQISAELRAKRLELDKLVKARKDAIRIEIMQAGRDVFTEYMNTLNKRIGKAYMPILAPDFAGAMKGLKTVSSIMNAVDTALANAKIEASAVADKICANLTTMRELATEHATLFPDAAQLALKENADLVLLVKARIAEHKAAEEKRLEAERERIRAEEAAKAIAAAQIQEPAKQDSQMGESASAATPLTVVSVTPRTDRPTDAEIIEAVAKAFGVDGNTAYEWLLNMERRPLEEEPPKRKARKARA
jgi:hypothetical protein